MQISYLLKYASLFYSLAAEHVPGKFLRVFDFDHVLATSTGLPWAVNPTTGEEYRLYRDNPSLPDTFTWKYNDKKGFWVIDKMPEGFKLDWREFSDLIVEGKPIDKYLNVLKNILKHSAHDTIILTARSNPITIAEFLAEQGLEFPIENIYTSASRGEDKAAVIDMLMTDYGYRNVTFWDDSKENIEAVDLLKNKWEDEAHIKTVLVPR